VCAKKVCIFFVATSGRLENCSTYFKFKFSDKSIVFIRCYTESGYPMLHWASVIRCYTGPVLSGVTLGQVIRCYSWSGYPVLFLVRLSGVTLGQVIQCYTGSGYPVLH